MFGSNKLKDTIKWLVLSADRQLAEDWQCDNRGIELADADDVRDRKRVFLD